MADSLTLNKTRWPRFLSFLSGLGMMGGMPFSKTALR